MACGDMVGAVAPKSGTSAVVDCGRGRRVDELTSDLRARLPWPPGKGWNAISLPR